MEHTPWKARPWMPLAMAALGHIIWGFSVLFSKVAMEVAQPDVLLSIRFLLSALLMTLMIGWEIGPEVVKEECEATPGHKMGSYGFFKICVKVITPLCMLFILYGQVASFFGL